LGVNDYLASIGLIPAPIQVFGCQPKLDNEVALQVLRLDLASFFAPEPQERSLIVAHDYPGVRAADERAARSGSKNRQRHFPLRYKYS
jgi:hypothetical protein